MDSFVDLGSPLKSLPVQVAALGSFSIIGFFFHPIGLALSVGLLFPEGLFLALSLVSTSKKYFTLLAEVLCFVILLRAPPLLLICFLTVYASL